MINLTVNNLPVEIESGTTVLEAIQLAGFNVPTLCHHPKLKPYGSCRLCLVEVEGARTLQPSCVVPAAEGMKIHTDTEKTRAARRFVLSMLFSERNHFCMYCQATDGDCDLQQCAYDEGMNHWPITPAYKPFYVDTSHPDFILDNNRCILCRRCIRTCAELVGNHTLNMEERGSATILIADDGLPLGESSCISCGNCVQICPTGALFDRRSAYQGRETDLTHTPSVCMDCSVGCYRVVKTRDNRLVRIDGDYDANFVEGMLCEKGRYAPVAKSKERVEQPFIRRNGDLVPVSWEEALSTFSTQLKAHAGEEISAYINGRQAAESQHAFRNFFKNEFEAGQVVMCGRDESAFISLELAKEFGPFESKLEVLNDADAAVILGADLINDHQVAGFMLKRKLSEDLALIQMTKEENSLGNNFSRKLIKVGEDFAELLDLVTGTKPCTCQDHEARYCQQALEGLAMAQQPVIVIGKDFATKENIDQLRRTIEFARSIDAKVVVLKGNTNSFAGSIYGLTLRPDLKGTVVAFYALGDGKPCPNALEALSASGYKIVQSSYYNEATELADIVLPSKIWSEEEGHYLTTDGRIELNRQAVAADEHQRSVREVLFNLSERSGFSLNADWQAELTDKISSVVLA